jgi:hypothetical protein
MWKRNLSVFGIVLFLISCSSVQPQRTFDGENFTSNTPPLKVQILHSEIKDSGNKAKNYKNVRVNSWWWYLGNREGIAVSIAKYTGKGFDYYYSLEHILRNQGNHPLGSVSIGKSMWEKYVFVNDQQYLHTGLFTRKDDYLIKVFRYKQIGGNMDEVESFKQTRVMSAQFEKRLQECFQRCEKLFRVVY